MLVLKLPFVKALPLVLVQCGVEDEDGASHRTANRCALSVWDFAVREGMSIFNNDFFSESRLQNSPNNMSLSNQPGTPRDDGEMGGNFLNPFQSESVSISLTVLLCTESLKLPYHSVNAYNCYY